MNIQLPIVVAEAQPDANVFPVLLRVLKLTRCLQNMRLAEIGLMNGQDEFLLALDENEPRCVCDLAEELGVRASTISKMVDVLSAKGLTARVTGDADQRKRFVCLTAAGKAACRSIRDVWSSLDVELTQSAVALNQRALQRDLKVLEAHIGMRLARLR